MKHLPARTAPPRASPARGGGGLAHTDSVRLTGPSASSQRSPIVKPSAIARTSVCVHATASEMSSGTGDEVKGLSLGTGQRGRRWIMVRAPMAKRTAILLSSIRDSTRPRPKTLWSSTSPTA